MPKKIVIFLIGISISCLVFISCSSSDNSSSSSKDSKSEITNTKFKEEVALACSKIDSKVFSQDFEIENANDFSEISLRFGEIEDELDGLISKFEDIEPTSEYSDDWETIIDDISHARDLFPQLADLFDQMQQISLSSDEITDNTQLQQVSNDLTEIQREAEDMTLDLTQTMEEIVTLSKKLDLGDCMTDS